MTALERLRVKIFADGANAAKMLELYRNPLIKGFTTNPTMMRAAGVSEYEIFARDLLRRIPDRPISFEVFSDESSEMERQAHTIASWGENVYVKIPITNTNGRSTAPLVERLARCGIKINVTAIMTLDQVKTAAAALGDAVQSNVSIFAGRIADTGTDPVPIVRDSVRALVKQPNVELIWASPREVLNVFHADSAGCHIITVTENLIEKLPLVGKDLTEYSLDTVKMFYQDGAMAKLKL